MLGNEDLKWPNFSHEAHLVDLDNDGIHDFALEGPEDDGPVGDGEGDEARAVVDLAQPYRLHRGHHDDEAVATGARPLDLGVQFLEQHLPQMRAKMLRVDLQVSGQEDVESQLENGDDSDRDKSKKNVDMREQAGEAHEETLYETTCTLYETDPTTASWVSKGTGIIHVNVDKNSLDEPSLRNSRLIMRQQGTMKVMWNVRLFKGMQLLPRQVSEGDRRMDVYVKMVLLDNGQPRTYALKLRNHVIMDQLYSAIQRAIPA